MSVSRFLPACRSGFSICPSQTRFHYHEVLTDIGLVQTTSMEEDLPETIRQLDALLPFRPALVEDLARQVRELGCEMVLCDIAPLGIAVAKEAGLPFGAGGKLHLGLDL